MRSTALRKGGNSLSCLPVPLTNALRFRFSMPSHVPCAVATETLHHRISNVCHTTCSILSTCASNRTHINFNICFSKVFPMTPDSRDIRYGIYRVSIKSFPDYKHLLQENYCTWNTNFFFFQNITQEVFFTTH